MEESSLSNNIHVNAAFEYEDETKSEKSKRNTETVTLE